MQTLDRILAVLLIALGCVHNFVAAPMIHSELTVRALWFISAGLALWYAGFINLLRTRPPGRDDRLLGWLCVLTNVTMLIHTLAYATVAAIWTDPPAILIVAGIAVLHLDLHRAASTIAARPEYGRCAARGLTTTRWTGP